MHRHSALPDFDNIFWMIDVTDEIVEENIAESAAENDAEEHGEDDIRHEIFINFPFFFAEEFLY